MEAVVILGLAMGFWPNGNAWSQDNALSFRNESNYVVLGSQGCIRGPFKIVDKNGKEVFSIENGKWYPLGCNKEH